MNRINLVNKEDIEFDIENSCAFSGHRIIKDKLNSKKIEKLIISLIEKGVKNFFVGMAIGFDSLAFHILEKIRKKYQIKIIACVPCANQDERFNLAQKQDYKKMLFASDYVVYLEQKYSVNCYMIRNKFMVDHSKYLICYLTENKGGTFNTMCYAKDNDREIFIVERN